MSQTNLAKMLAMSGSKLLAKRADNLSTLIRMKQDALVRNLEEELINLTIRKEGLMDMSVKTKDSLVFVSDKFNSDEFVEELQALNVDMRNKSIELDLARAQWDSWFGASE